MVEKSSFNRIFSIYKFDKLPIVAGSDRCMLRTRCKAWKKPRVLVRNGRRPILRSADRIAVAHWSVSMSRAHYANRCWCQLTRSTDAGPRAGQRARWRLSAIWLFTLNQNYQFDFASYIPQAGCWLVNKFRVKCARQLLGEAFTRTVMATVNTEVVARHSHCG